MVTQELVGSDAVTLEQVDKVLRAQGFAVPRADLEEVTARINAIVAGFLQLDYVDTQLEPWPHVGVLLR